MDEREIFLNYPDVVRVEEVQEMLRIGRNTVYELLESGSIKSLRVGKKYVIPKKCVINYLASCLQ